MERTNDNLLNSIISMIQNVKIYDRYPNFDEVCEKMKDLDNNNRIRAESYFLLYLLERGETGIRSFSIKALACLQGANPFEELFYFAVKYNMVAGISMIISMRDSKSPQKNVLELQAEKMDKSPLQSYLFYELCVAIRFEDFCKTNNVSGFTVKKAVEPTQYAEQLRVASSPNRKKDRTTLRGHIKLDSSITKIEDRYFYGCRGITIVEFPQNLKAIGTSAFESCTDLRIVALPKNLKELGDRAFANCIHLHTVTTM